MIMADLLGTWCLHPVSYKFVRLTFRLVGLIVTLSIWGFITGTFLHWTGTWQMIRVFLMQCMSQVYASQTPACLLIVI